MTPVLHNVLYTASTTLSLNKGACISDNTLGVYKLYFQVSGVTLSVSHKLYFQVSDDILSVSDKLLFQVSDDILSLSHKLHF